MSVIRIPLGKSRRALTLGLRDLPPHPSHLWQDSPDEARPRLDENATSLRWPLLTVAQPAEGLPPLARIDRRRCIVAHVILPFFRAFVQVFRNTSQVGKGEEGCAGDASA